MHVVRGLGTGGTETMCLRLASHWQLRFRQNVVAWPSEQRSLEPLFHAISQLKLEIVPHFRDEYPKWAWLRRTIGAHAPDAVLIHMFGRPHLLAAAAARAAGVSAVAASAGNPSPREADARRRWASIIVASRLLRCPIMSCSHAVDENLRSLGVGMPAGSRPIPNGIDVDAMISHGRGVPREQEHSRRVIGMVARLDEIKDHATLLQAFARLQTDMPDNELWIIGEGALRCALERQALQLGIAASTRFFGGRTDIRELLARVDVFAFSTSHREGFGIALIEAMAARVPIVASDVPACREVLSGGDTGILVPPGNPAALSEAITQLLQNDELCKRLVEAARRRVELEYSIEVCGRRWEALLFPREWAPEQSRVTCAS